MIVQVRTDNHIQNTAELSESIRTDVEGTLAVRFGDRLRRVEVYLEDMNAHKGGVDTRCTIEVHLAGRPAVTAEDRAEDIETAFGGAMEKVLRVLDRQLGRLEDRAGNTPASGQDEL